MLQRGTRAVTIEAVSRSVGAPSGTIYNRFGSRDGLAREAWLRAVRRSQAFFLKAAAIPDGADRPAARRAGVAAALSLLDFAAAHSADAQLLATVRARDIEDRTSAGAAGPPETGSDPALNAPIEQSVGRLARALFDSDDREAIETVALATIDLPLGAVRRHLSAGRVVPKVIAAQLRTATAAVLDPHPAAGASPSIGPERPAAASEIESAAPGRPGAVMVAEVDIQDPVAFFEYGRRVIPMLARWGGEVLAIAPPGTQTIEGEPAARALVVHSWPSAARFSEFYDAPEYQPLKQLRQRATGSRLTAFDSLPPGWRPPVTGG